MNSPVDLQQTVDLWPDAVSDVHILADLFATFVMSLGAMTDPTSAVYDLVKCPLRYSTFQAAVSAVKAVVRRSNLLIAPLWWHLPSFSRSPT